MIATTSELMTTGVDAKTCKLIVLDKNISSMTTFKQIVGRGTRIEESQGKYFFTILDFKNATKLFRDEEFDGEPVVIYTPGLTTLSTFPTTAMEGRIMVKTMMTTTRALQSCESVVLTFVSSLGE